MCLFLWQASIYPALGEGSKNEALLSNNIEGDPKKVNNANDIALGNTMPGTIKIVVQHGDSLWGLAQKHHTTVNEIAKLNKLISPNLIEEGETLWVPSENKEVNVSYLSSDVRESTNISWWENILRCVPVLASVFKRESNFPQAINPQQSQSTIQTYEIIVNKDTQLIDKPSENNSSPDAQKTEPQKRASPGTESHVLSRGLGRLVSKEEVELLTRVIYGEARGENFEGQVAVGAVVLNRLKDPRFPKSIGAIIYQPGAFTAVDDQQIYLEPDSAAYKAAEAALAGMDPTNGAIYYYNPRIATDRWIKSRPVIKRIGNHTFSI